MRIRMRLKRVFRLKLAQVVLLLWRPMTWHVAVVFSALCGMHNSTHQRCQAPIVWRIHGTRGTRFRSAFSCFGTAYYCAYESTDFLKRSMAVQTLQMAILLADSVMSNVR